MRSHVIQCNSTQKNCHVNFLELGCKQNTKTQIKKIQIMISSISFKTERIETLYKRIKLKLVKQTVPLKNQIYNYRNSKKVGQNQQDLYPQLNWMKFPTRNQNRYEDYEKKNFYQVWIKDMQIIGGKNQQYTENFQNKDFEVTFGISGAGFQEYIIIVSSGDSFGYYMNYDKEAQDYYWDRDDEEPSLEEIEKQYIKSLCNQWNNDSQTNQLSKGKLYYQQDQRFTKDIFIPNYLQDQRFIKIIFTPDLVENCYLGEIEVNKENGQIEKSIRSYSQCLRIAIMFGCPMYMAMSLGDLGYIKEEQEELRANQSEKKNNMQTAQIERTDSIQSTQQQQQQQLSNKTAYQLLHQIQCQTFQLIQLRSVTENQRIFLNQKTVDLKDQYEGCGFDMEEHYQVWIKDLKFTHSRDLEVIFGVANADYPECTIPLSKETIRPMNSFDDYEIDYHTSEENFLEILHEYWKSLTKSELYYFQYKGVKPDPFQNQDLLRQRQKNQYRDDCFVRYVLRHGSAANWVQKHSLIDGQFDVRFCRLSKCVYDAILTLRPVYLAKSFVERYASNQND
eukprot:TRINITY_DN3120_c0_g1_i8.p1 TRINITY_DN3120_c0_g1~~TRINITY_DN3120_c0_g1_i8.p1  ORF type:complete len:562 (-),score=17.53 TRINITY_DN3120_c0_g1_i8:199-1884(-)